VNTAPTDTPEPAARFLGPGAWREGLRYGLLGLPLAFVALPLYVILPNHYARAFGAPLALLGAVLLAARLVDAVLDPWIGRWCDRLFARSVRAVMTATGIDQPEGRSMEVPVEPDRLRTIKVFVTQPTGQVDGSAQSFRFVVEDKASFETDEYKATFNAPEKRR